MHMLPGLAALLYSTCRTLPSHLRTPRACQSSPHLKALVPQAWSMMHRATSPKGEPSLHGAHPATLHQVCRQSSASIGSSVSPEDLALLPPLVPFRACTLYLKLKCPGSLSLRWIEPEKRVQRRATRHTA